MTSRYAVAPAPPAGPGSTPEDHAIEHYLGELGRWRLHRDHELRTLDQVIRTHDERDGLNGDLTASMTLWHAIAQRHDLLLATWEDAQDGDGEPDRVGRLIWGVLELPDGDAQALAIALPEALRLSDALAASLRARTDAEEDPLPAQDRLAALEADLARLRSQLEAAVADHAARLAPLEEELGGLREDTEPDLATIGGLEAAVALLERDVIVAAATAAHDRADGDHARAERDHLVARGEAVRSLAERVLNTVHPAPRLGIPDVTALGAVPEDAADLAAYVANLERVGRALDQAHTTYAAALAEYADLADRAERLAKTLAGCGAPTSVDLAGMLTATKESLHNQPADLQRAAALVAAQEAYLGQLRPDA